MKGTLEIIFFAQIKNKDNDTIEFNDKDEGDEIFRYREV